MSASNADIINIECSIVKKIDCKYVLCLHDVGCVCALRFVLRVPGTPISRLAILSTPIGRLAVPGPPLLVRNSAGSCKVENSKTTAGARCLAFEITILWRFTSMSAGQTEIGLEYPSRNIRRPRETASQPPDRSISFCCGIRDNFVRIRASANENDIELCGQTGLGSTRSLGSK